jgi:hypothetical protein
VDGSFGTWTYIQSYLYQVHESQFTPSSVQTLLPVVHKYDFAKPRSALMQFVSEKVKELSADANRPTYIIPGFVSAERSES